MAVPVIESSTDTLQGANSTTFTMAMPATRPAGDLYVAVITKDDDLAITPPGDGSWIQLISATSGSNNERHAVYWKIGTNSEPASYIWTGGNEEWVGTILHITGFDSAAPINTTNIATGAAGAPLSPSLQPTVPGALILRTVGVDSDDFPTGYEPTGTTPVFENSSSGGGNGAASAGVAYSFGNATNVATGTAQFNGVDDSWVAVTIAIAPSTPYVTNAPATNITSSTAYINGGLVSTGTAATTVFVYWGTEDRTNDVGSWDGSSNLGVYAEGDAITTMISGLDDETAYYYRYYATNANGGNWATSAKSFNTLADVNHWDYRMKIVFDGYDHGETLTNFPALVNFNSGIDEFSYDQFEHTDGYDLRFSDSNEVQVLNYEIERWDTNGTSSIWVQVPLLSSTNDYIWAYWGKAVATQPAYTTNGATWSEGFVGVWHLSETNGPHIDSSPYSNDGTITNGTDQEATGTIAGADFFDGANAEVYIPASTGDELSDMPAITVEAWVNLDAFENFATIVVKPINANPYPDPVWSLTQGAAGDNNAVFGVNVGGGWAEGSTALNTLASNSFYHVSGSWDGSTVLAYANAIRGDTTGSGSGAMEASDKDVWLARYGNQGTGNFALEGIIDEVRISEVARSSNWIWASWLNQGFNSTFTDYRSVLGRPVVSNDGGATNITASTASLRSLLSFPGSDDTTVFFYWGTNDAGASNSSWEHTNIIANASGGILSSVATGLIANQTNFYRCYATNIYGDAWASETTNFLTAPPTVSFSGTPYTVWETDLAYTVTVALATASVLPLSVTYSTADGTALSVVDYGATNGLLSWSALETASKSFVILLTNDVLDELDELFDVVLSTPTNAVIGTSTTTVEITDDEGVPSLQYTVGASSGNEAVNPALLEVQLSFTSGSIVLADYSVVSGTASNGVDYSLAAGQITIAAGASNALISITITNDALEEFPETIVVGLSNVVNAVFSARTNHTYTLIDDAIPSTIDNALGAIEVTSTSAELRGNVIATGEDTPVVRVYWGTVDGLMNRDNWDAYVDMGVQGVGSFSTTLTTLSDGQLYYYRSYSTNDGGASWAPQSEHFIAKDPTIITLLVNGSFETQGASATSALNWAQSGETSRQQEFPLTGSYTIRYDRIADISVFGSVSNSFRVSWDGQFSGGGVHLGGGIRPGFLLNGQASTRAKSSGVSAEFRYQWTNVTSGGSWMSTTITNQSDFYANGAISIASSLPVPTADVGDVFRPELTRHTAGSPGEFHQADDLSIAAVLPTMSLDHSPAVTFAFPATGEDFFTDINFGVRNTGGSGTVLYGAYITNPADLTSSAWPHTAWHEFSDPSNAFSIVSNITLATTSSSGWQYAVIRFTPPGIGSFTSTVRVATTDPEDRFAGGGTINGINYEEYTLVGVGYGAPVLTNEPATSVTMDTASLNGDLTSADGSTYVWLYWGATDGQDTNSNWAYTNSFGLRSEGALTTNLIDLLVSQQYFYRYYATNSAGATWATPSEQFVTLTPPGTLFQFQ